MSDAIGYSLSLIAMGGANAPTLKPLKARRQLWLPVLPFVRRPLAGRPSAKARGRLRATRDLRNRVQPALDAANYASRAKIEFASTARAASAWPTPHLPPV